MCFNLFIFVNKNNKKIYIYYIFCFFCFNQLLSYYYYLSSFNIYSNSEIDILPSSFLSYNNTNYDHNYS